MTSRAGLLVLFSMVAWQLGTSDARAELVLLTSGRVLSVTSHEVVGDAIVLQMRNGGEITCHRGLVRQILPDEIPYVEEGAEDDSAPVRTVTTASLAGTPFGEIIQTVAQAHGVDPLLVRALIEVESGYRPRARSHKGAMGLMQLMPATARRYEVTNPYDPKANIAAGVMHLKSLIDRWGGVELALAAYNAGEAAVRKFNGIPPYRETRAYVARILSLAGLK